MLEQIQTLAIQEYGEAIPESEVYKIVDAVSRGMEVYRAIKMYFTFLIYFK